MHVRRPTWSQLAMILVAISAALLALTRASPDWVERALAVAPDGGDGSAEWGVAACCTIVALVCCARAASRADSRRELRRDAPHRAAPEVSPART